ERGDFAEAQGRLMEAIGLAEAANDPFALLDLYTSIATVFAKQKRWEKVRFYAHRGLRLAEERGVQFNQAQNKELLGESHLHLDSISTGLDYLRTAFDQYKALKLPILAARVLLLLSKEQTDKGYLQAARAYLRDAFRVRENTADRLGSLQAMLLLAELELLEGNSKYALSLLQQCEAESMQMGAQNHLQRSHELLAKAYQKEGNYETALYHFKVYTAIKYSIQSVEIAREVEQLEIQFQTAETKKQLAEQQATNAQQTNKLQAQNFQLLLLIVGIALAVLLAGFLQFRNTKNKQLLAQRIQVMEKEQEAQQLKALIAGEEKERKRVAQELHDGLGVLLATVKMQINGIQKVLPGVSNSNHYQKAEQLIDQACRTVREISHDMLPYVLEEEGFDSAVQRLCTSVANTHELDISFIPFEVELIEGDALKVSLYRSVQELLKNIIKHAEASEVIVQIIAEPEQVELTVEDNGKGFDLAAKKDGIGLKNIQSRVEYLNGQFEMESTIGQGSTFTIRIPLENDAL
ncbi:MAG: sensor histidine kinase, partial [Bacteroidota bacterium]